MVCLVVSCLFGCGGGSLDYIDGRPVSSRAYEWELLTPKETRKEKGFSSGTGFFISKDGYLITNFHVVEDAKEIIITNSKGEEHTAKYIRGDSANDVALLKVETEAIAAPIAAYANVTKGDEVFTLGYPLIQIQGQEQKATFGRINALSGFKNDVHFLQIDVPIQPGNSGGPLISKNGLVIGIVTGTLNQVRTLVESGVLSQNVNYAVKSDYIIPIIRDIVKASDGQVNVRNYDLSNLVKQYEPSVVLVVAR